MGVYINGVLTPPVNAAELDGVPADLQPIAGKAGYVVTLTNGELTLEPTDTPTFGSGALGALPLTPGVGDQYLATDYDVTLECVVAGTWRVTGADRLGVTLGPFAGFYTASGIVTTTSGTSVGPTLANGQSFAIGFWCSALTAAEQVLWSSQSGGNGYIVGLNAGADNSHHLYLFRTGVTGPGPVGKVPLTSAIVLGANTLCVALAADGLSFTWSLNGSAAATIVTAGVYVPPDAACFNVLGNYQPGAVPFVDGSVAWAQAWSTVLSGATTTVVSTARARLLPGDPGGATSIYAFLAAKEQAGIQFGNPTGSAATPIRYNGMASARVQRL